MRGDILCEKCSADLGYGWDAQRHQVQLIGSFQAIICHTCQNLWGDYVEATPEYDKLRKILSETEITTGCYLTTGGKELPDAKSVLTPLHDAQHAAEKEIRELARAWVADKLPVPQTVTPRRLRHE